MYFPQNIIIKHFTYHLFSQTFLCVPFTLCLFEKITHHPPRAACLSYEHICLSRTSFYILCEMLNDFVADNYKKYFACFNFRLQWIFVCEGIPFLVWGIEKSIRMDKIKNAFSPFFLDYFWYVFLYSLYKQCIEKIVLCV